MIRESDIIVDSRAIWRHSKISADTAKSESNESKPFERADREPLYVTFGYVECEDCVD